MKTTLTNEFGSPIIRIKNALLALKSGKGIILLDDENRENEGDFVFSSEAISIEKMALVIRYGSGIVCLCITEKKRQQLELPMMVQKNTSTYGTGFTVSIEAKLGITTGVSAQDRLTTIQAASAKNASPNDLNKPGHIFPLRGHCNGILARPGHTEASLELMTLAGLQPTSIICELTNKDGSMAKTPEVIKFSKKNKMPVLTIKDIINYIK